MLVVGLISGTSVDGIDAAVVELWGEPPRLGWRALAHVTVPYAPELRQAIFAGFQTGSAEQLCQLNVWLGQAFAEAALQAIAAADLRPSQIDLVGSHGQTLWHCPDGSWPSTLQLGEAAVIAERLQVPVINNFRARDMAAGGQGAPLVAYVDTLLLSDSRRRRAAQNIGGIGNVTYLPAHSEAEVAFAFDTGPGNMLIDDAVARTTQGALAYDRDGILAAQGRVDAGLLRQLLADPYLQQPPPKTTGRERYGAQLGEQLWQQTEGMDPHDRIATLTAYTAHSIAEAYRRWLPRLPAEVLVSGGGAQNPTLMAMLSELLDPIPVRSTQVLGLPPQAKEAIAFAVLAYESWHQRPGNLPAATGAKGPVVLGQITPAPAAPRPDSTSLTEARNPDTRHIDEVSTPEMVRLLAREDARVAQAVAAESAAIAMAIEAIADRIRRGGRLIYLGAGTSGRLGVLDAAECPPTFGTDPSLVLALIAGGTAAITEAVEGAEDSELAGGDDIARLAVSECDSVVGIAASGRTPYVLGGIREAQRRRALTVGLACNHPSPLTALADLSIAPLVGAEAILGSTRLKAGTAQKLVLNQISTGVMIRLGKTYSNLMVDLKASNQKLRTRCRRMVELACDLDPESAAAWLDACDGEVKVAIVAALNGSDPAQARRRLQAAGGIVRRALPHLESSLDPSR